jgi:hypothetical protein
VTAILVAVLVAGCLPVASAPVASAPVASAPVASAPVASAPVAPAHRAPFTGAPRDVPASEATGTAEPPRASTAQLEAFEPAPPSLDRVGRLAIPTPRPDPLANLDPPPDHNGAFSIDLYRKGDFVSEATKWYCVPAAIQSMINIMSPGAERTRAAQDRYYRQARRFSTDRLVGRGAEPEGWATVLEREGFGDFRVVANRSRSRAIEIAAMALRMTGKPVGLLVWRGAHAWVMSGFRATADPAVSDDYRVTHVDIVDVWYPRISSIWGASRPPGTRIPVEKLPEDYLRWRRPTVRYPEKDGKFVMVIPVAETARAA